MDWLQQNLSKEFSIPHYIYLLILAIIIGGGTFLIRIISPIDQFPLGIPLAFILTYLMMFSVGIIAVRYDWFEKMSKDNIKVWGITIAAAFVGIFLYFIFGVGLDSDMTVFMGGLNPHALVFAIAENVVAMGMIFVLIPIVKLRYDNQGPLLQTLSVNSYNIYLIHAPILVLISLLFASVQLFPVIKLAIVFPTTVIICYLISNYFLRKILRPST
jgi:hypothetical protein